MKFQKGDAVKIKNDGGNGIIDRVLPPAGYLVGFRDGIVLYYDECDFEPKEGDK